ncbi:MAG TPA: hypothetical protein VHV82_11160 [Sporichthyaceae bacterium]|jgi:hypothetical protein|nr:hypothetical protein [Sporichthyaceae bacterium]
MASLYASAVTAVLGILIGSVGYYVRRRHQRLDLRAEQQRLRYRGLLAATARLSTELPAFTQVRAVYGQWLAGGRVLTKQLPPPPGPLEVGDRLSSLVRPIFDHWTDAWLYGDRAEIIAANRLVDVVRDVVGDVLVDNQPADALRRLGIARRDFANFARTQLGSKEVDLFATSRTVDLVRPRSPWRWEQPPTCPTS